MAVVLGAWCLVKIERWVRKWMPESLDIVFTPLITMIPVSYTHLDVYKRQLGAVEQVDLVQTSTLTQLHDLNTQVPHGLGLSLIHILRRKRPAAPAHPEWAA